MIRAVLDWHLATPRRKAGSLAALAWLVALTLGMASASEGCALFTAAALILTVCAVLTPTSLRDEEERDLPLPSQWRIQQSRRFKVRTLRLLHVGDPSAGEQPVAVKRGLSHRKLWDQLADVAWHEERRELVRQRRAFLAAEEAGLGIMVVPA